MLPLLLLLLLYTVFQCTAVRIPNLNVTAALSSSNTNNFNRFDIMANAWRWRKDKQQDARLYRMQADTPGPLRVAKPAEMSRYSIFYEIQGRTYVFRSDDEGSWQVAAAQPPSTTKQLAGNLSGISAGPRPDVLEPAFDLAETKHSPFESLGASVTRTWTRIRKTKHDELYSVVIERNTRADMYPLRKDEMVMRFLVYRPLDTAARRKTGSMANLYSISVSVATGRMRTVNDSKNLLRGYKKAQNNGQNQGTAQR